MINKDRIVAVTKSDLLSLIGTMLAIANVSYSVLKSSDVEGNFTVQGSGAAGNILADQPVKTMNFESGVTGATVYFLADYGFEGFQVAGAAAQMGSGSVDVIPDASTLYKAVLASSKVTITAVTPVAE